MSYLVFARKYRPLTFDDVVGQEHITNTLKKAIEKERVAHAFIFSGTRGVGKTTTARILARALNCDKGPTPSPCGTCDSCKGVGTSTSLDVLEIDGASNNSVDDIRELRENVGYTSMGGKYRIFVIDEVHMLSKAAFNALLKTLEEPPPKVIFIFATTEPEKIPPTIHSRCQRYDFRRIVPEQIRDRLAAICTKEGIDFDVAALMLIARKAEGSMRDALSLLDQVCAYCPEKLLEDEVRRVLGLVGMEIYGRIVDAVAQKQPAATLAVVQEILFQGFDLHEFVLGLQEHLRALLFSRIPGAVEAAGLSAESAESESLRKSAARFSEGDLMRMMEIARRGESELRFSAYPRFAIEMALLKMAFLDSSVSIEKLMTMLDSPSADGDCLLKKLEIPQDGKKKIDFPVAEVVTPARAEHAPPFSPEEPSRAGFEESASCNKTDVRKAWPGFSEKLLRDRPNLGMFISLGVVINGSESSIDLQFPAECSFQFGEVTKKNQREEIEKQLDGFMGRHVDLHLTIENRKPEDAAAGQIYITNDTDPRAIETEIEREPVIKSILDMFDGDLIR